MDAMDIGEALPDENIPFAIHIQAPVIDEFAPDEVDDNNNDVQMAAHNDPLAEDAFAQDALLIGEHPAEATGIEAELPQQIIPPENAPCLRRSTRNPKYTKKMKLYKGLPSSDDDEDANADADADDDADDDDDAVAVAVAVADAAAGDGDAR